MLIKEICLTYKYTGGEGNDERNRNRKTVRYKD